MKIHTYEITEEWTGNPGKGTMDYKTFTRHHIVSGENKRTLISGKMKYYWNKN